MTASDLGDLGSVDDFVVLDLRIRQTDVDGSPESSGPTPLTAPTMRVTSTLPLPPAASAEEMHDDANATEAVLGQIQRSLSADYPWASTDHIGEVLRSRYERTRDAKVQNYRLVLAERETRTQLRHEQRR